MFNLRRISKNRSRNGSTPSVHPSVLPQLYGMSTLCNVTPKVFIQALHNDCSHIEDVHLLFCAHIMNIFSSFRGVELRYFPSHSAKMVSGLCNL